MFGKPDVGSFKEGQGYDNNGPQKLTSHLPKEPPNATPSRLHIKLATSHYFTLI